MTKMSNINCFDSRFFSGTNTQENNILFTEKTPRLFFFKQKMTDARRVVFFFCNTYVNQTIFDSAAKNTQIVTSLHARVSIVNDQREKLSIFLFKTAIYRDSNTCLAIFCSQPCRVSFSSYSTSCVYYVHLNRFIQIDAIDT